MPVDPSGALFEGGLVNPGHGRHLFVILEEGRVVVSNLLVNLRSTFLDLQGSVFSSAFRNPFISVKCESPVRFMNRISLEVDREKTKGVCSLTPSVITALAYNEHVGFVITTLLMDPCLNNLWRFVVRS